MLVLDGKRVVLEDEYVVGEERRGGEERGKRYLPLKDLVAMIPRLLQMMLVLQRHIL